MNRIEGGPEGSPGPRRSPPARPSPVATSCSRRGSRRNRSCTPRQRGSRPCRRAARTTGHPRARPRLHRPGLPLIGADDDGPLALAQPPGRVLESYRRTGTAHTQTADRGPCLAGILAALDARITGHQQGLWPENTDPFRPFETGRAAAQVLPASVLRNTLVVSCSDPNHGHAVPVHRAKFPIAKVFLKELARFNALHILHVIRMPDYLPGRPAVGGVSRWPYPGETHIEDRDLLAPPPGPCRRPGRRRGRPWRWISFRRQFGRRSFRHRCSSRPRSSTWTGTRRPVVQSTKTVVPLILSRRIWGLSCPDRRPWRSGPNRHRPVGWPAAPPDQG